MIGVEKIFKLSSNELPLGPSSSAIEAFRREADNLAFYPDGSAQVLREAIATKYGLGPITSYAGMAPTNSYPCWPMLTFGRAMRACTANTVFLFIRLRFGRQAASPSWRVKRA